MSSTRDANCVKGYSENQINTFRACTKMQGSREKSDLMDSPKTVPGRYREVLSPRKNEVGLEPDGRAM